MASADAAAATRRKKFCNENEKLNNSAKMKRVTTEGRAVIFGFLFCF